MEWNLKQTLAHMLLSISINPTIPLFASLQFPGIFALGVRAEGQQLAPWLPLWWRCLLPWFQLIVWPWLQLGFRDQWYCVLPWLLLWCHDESYLTALGLELNADPSTRICIFKYTTIFSVTKNNPYFLQNISSLLFYSNFVQVTTALLIV